VHTRVQLFPQLCSASDLCMALVARAMLACVEDGLMSAERPKYRRSQKYNPGVVASRLRAMQLCSSCSCSYLKLTLIFAPPDELKYWMARRYTSVLKFYVSICNDILSLGLYPFCFLKRLRMPHLISVIGKTLAFTSTPSPRCCSYMLCRCAPHLLCAKRGH